MQSVDSAEQLESSFAASKWERKELGRPSPDMIHAHVLGTCAKRPNDILGSHLAITSERAQIMHNIYTGESEL